MSNFWKNYFSTDNKINEAVVVGTVLLPVLIVGIFLPVVDVDKLKIVALLIGGCFGIGGARAAVSKKL